MILILAAANICLALIMCQTYQLILWDLFDYYFHFTEAQNNEQVSQGQAAGERQGPVHIKCI